MGLIGKIQWAALVIIFTAGCALSPGSGKVSKTLTLPDSAPSSKTSETQQAGANKTSSRSEEISPAPAPDTPKIADTPGSAAEGNASLGPFIIEELEEPSDEAEPTYDVPIVLNESVEAHLQFFQTGIKDRFELWLTRSGRYIPLMKEIFKSYGLPEDLVFVALIESGFNPAAYSRARAVGPWQFIKGTGRKYGLRIDTWIDERRDPIKSTIAAAKYLRDLYNMFESWPLALASYNAGEGRVMRAIARTGSDDFWDLRSTHYLRRETRNYVPKFMAATIIAKNPERYGFKLEPWEPLQFDEVIIESPTDLRVVAEAAGITYKDLRELNPELRSTITPLNHKEYLLKLPYGTRDAFLENFAQIPPEKRMIQLRHRVRRGETLSRLARKYGTTVQAIRELNNLGRSSLIRERQYLLIPMSSSIASGQERRKIDAPVSFAPPKIEPGSNQIVYQVRRGDTLSTIAARYGTTIWAIRRLNNLGRSSLIRQGQYLLIPLGSNTVVSEETGYLKHRVKRGETLSTIARKYATTVTALQQLNQMGRSSLIHQGQYLLIPVIGNAKGEKWSSPSQAASSMKEAGGDGLKKIIYRVRWGDTLWEISRYFNVSIQQIRKWNGLSRSSTLKAGRRLVLYVHAEQS